MSGRIFLFGATGYTGRITAELLTVGGAAPVLVGRSRTDVEKLAEDLAPLAPGGRPPSSAVADAERPKTLRGLLSDQDDVLVSTVGPFARYGRPAVETVIDYGAAYVDCTAEPTFIREVFEDQGRRAQRTGARLLPGMGRDYAPGNLAAALLLDRLAETPHRIDVGYLVTGPYTPSSGSVGTVGAMLLDPSFGYHDGNLVSQRPGAHVRSFPVHGELQDALSIGGTEQFTVPRLAPAVKDVNVYVGWTGRWSRAASAAGIVASNARSVPGVGSAMSIVMRAALGGASNNGPAAHQRRKCRSVIIAEGYNESGEQLGRVTLDGPNPYDLTAALLSWSARMLARRAEKAVGSLGPIGAFGLDAFLGGCTAIDLVEIEQ